MLEADGVTLRSVWLCMVRTRVRVEARQAEMQRSRCVGRLRCIQGDGVSSGEDSAELEESRRTVRSAQTSG